jgi:hypothetical protein
MCIEETSLNESVVLTRPICCDWNDGRPLMVQRRWQSGTGGPASPPPPPASEGLSLKAGAVGKAHTRPSPQHMTDGLMHLDRVVCP